MPVRIGQEVVLKKNPSGTVRVGLNTETRNVSLNTKINGNTEITMA